MTPKREFEAEHVVFEFIPPQLWMKMKIRKMVQRLQRSRMVILEPGLFQKIIRHQVLPPI